MATYKTPGVYVKETGRNPPAFDGQPTSIPAFIGYAGPDAISNISPVKILSFSEFANRFGNDGGEKFLHESIDLFYKNGGNECYIIPVGNIHDPVSLSAFLAGLEASKPLPVQLLVMPDASLLPGPDFYSLQKQALAAAAVLHDRFVILDTVRPSGNCKNDQDTFRAGIGNDNLKWGAAYYPWLKPGNGRALPPSGAVAGAYAMTDQTRGVWKAPANVSLSGVTDLTNHITNEEQETMNMPFDGKAINALRLFPGKGILIWSGRTLDGNCMDWRYVSVRRTITFIEQSIQKGAGWVVFEPNDANTWTALKAMIENFLLGLWRQGALAGTKPEEAFTVHIGLGTSMTAVDILEGILRVFVNVAVSRPAEFIVIAFQFQTRKS